MVGQTVWAPRNAGELLYWPATVVSQPFEAMDPTMTTKIASVQIQYYGPPSQPASVPLESLQAYGNGELAKQHLSSVMNPQLMQLLADAIVQASKHVSAHTGSTNINTMELLTVEKTTSTPATTSSPATAPMTSANIDSRFQLTDESSDVHQQESTSSTPAAVAAGAPTSASSSQAEVEHKPSTSGSSHSNASSVEASATPVTVTSEGAPALVATEVVGGRRLPPGLHVRILQAALAGQVGVVLHAPTASGDDIYTVRSLANGASYQLSRHLLEECGEALVAQQSQAQAALFAYQQQQAVAAAAAAAAAAQQQQSSTTFATAEPYIGQAVRVTKGEGSGRTGTIVAWQPEYYAFRVRLGRDEVLKRNDELELLTAPVYRIMPSPNATPVPANVTTLNGVALDQVGNNTGMVYIQQNGQPLTAGAPPPSGSTRAHQPILVTPQALPEKKRKPHIPRSKSVRNLVGKYVMIEAGRYKGEIGYVAKGGNGYYGVIKLPNPTDTIVETQPVMKRSADLSLVSLTPEQRAEHERGVQKYFPHLVYTAPTNDKSPSLEASSPPLQPTPLPSGSIGTPSSGSLTSSLSNGAPPAPSPTPSTMSESSATPAPSPSPTPWSQSSMAGSPLRAQRQPAPSPSPSSIYDGTSDDDNGGQDNDDDDDQYDDNGRASSGGPPADRNATSKRKRRAHLTPVGSKTESWVDRRVLVTVGKYRGEVGTIIKSGHGFYCVDIPTRGEVMKRAAELELYDVGGTIPVTHGHAPASDAKLRKAAFILIDLMKDQQASLVRSKRARLTQNDDDHAATDIEEPITTVFGRPAASRPSPASESNEVVAMESKRHDDYSDDNSDASLTSSPSLQLQSNTKPVVLSSYHYRRQHASARRSLDKKEAFRPRHYKAAGLAPL